MPNDNLTPTATVKEAGDAARQAAIKRLETTGSILPKKREKVS